MESKPIDFKNLSIISYPDPLLRQPARPLIEVNSDIHQLAERMIDLMVSSGGIGLAAPQVGVSLRLIVISLSGKRHDAEAYINPELDNFHGASEMEEGCLSVPGVRAKVRRHAGCTVKALDLDGSEFILDAVDMTATVFQHETDHLNGVLFIDRLNTVSKMACRRGLKQLEITYQNR